jgi:hypothetical protein
MELPFPVPPCVLGGEKQCALKGGLRQETRHGNVFDFWLSFANEFIFTTFKYSSPRQDL